MILNLSKIDLSSDKKIEDIYLAWCYLLNFIIDEMFLPG
jgi:hypothetical protein